MSKRKRSEMAISPSRPLQPLEGKHIQAVAEIYNDLRAAGVDSEVKLPATVVAGDTSAGKSSVLSRLTGLPFPRGEDVVTRFATEVEMKPADAETITVTIVPDEQRPSDQRAMLKQFGGRVGADKFEDTFTTACATMASLGTQVLYADVLHIEYQGRDCRPLTIIDLPGLIHAATSTVTDADRRLSEKLAKKYLKENRTIVLAVISASNEVVNQAITRMTRNVDKQGKRTMGIVTKVDTVCGKAKDTQLLKILSNEVIPLDLGWHALVNTVDNEPEATDDQIAKAEAGFFSQTRFAAIDKNATGIENLRSRVVQVVGDKLVQLLPQLRDEAQTKLAKACDDLKELGDPIAELIPQRKHLSGLFSRFQLGAQAEIDGVYANPAMMQKYDDTFASGERTLRADSTS